MPRVRVSAERRGVVWIPVAIQQTFQHHFVLWYSTVSECVLGSYGAIGVPHLRIPPRLRIPPAVAMICLVLVHAAAVWRIVTVLCSRTLVISRCREGSDTVFSLRSGGTSALGVKNEEYVPPAFIYKRKSMSEYGEYLGYVGGK